MGVIRERDVQLFLLPEDELAIAAAILREYPDVAFLDETQWVDPEIPPSRGSIIECGRIAGIWNRSVYPKIRGRRRVNGRVDGPEQEIVQWVRSRLGSPDVLHSGRWAYSFPEAVDPAMVAFVDRIWRILFKATTNRMRRASAVDPNTPERGYRVGASAFMHSAAGDLVLAANALRLAPEVGYVWPK